MALGVHRSCLPAFCFFRIQSCVGVTYTASWQQAHRVTHLNSQKHSVLPRTEKTSGPSEAVSPSGPPGPKQPVCCSGHGPFLGLLAAEVPPRPPRACSTVVAFFGRQKTFLAVTSYKHTYQE